MQKGKKKNKESIKKIKKEIVKYKKREE